jgi:hypothetical protein
VRDLDTQDVQQVVAAGWETVEESLKTTPAIALDARAIVVAAETARVA